MLLKELSEEFERKKRQTFSVRVVGNEDEFVAFDFISIEPHEEKFFFKINTAAVVPKYALSGFVKEALERQSRFGLRLGPMSVLRQNSDSLAFRVREAATARQAGKLLLYSVYEAVSLFAIKAFNETLLDREKAYRAYERLCLGLRNSPIVDVEVVAEVRKIGPAVYEIEYSPIVLPSQKHAEISRILTEVFGIPRRRTEVLQSLNRSHWVLNPKMKERTRQYFNRVRIDFEKETILVEQAKRSPGPNIETVASAFLILAKKAVSSFPVDEEVLYRKALALYQGHQRLVKRARGRSSGVAAGIAAAFVPKEPKRVVLVRAVKDLLGKRVRVYEKTYSLEKKEGSYSVEKAKTSDFYLSVLTEKFRKRIDRERDILFVGSPEVVKDSEDLYDLSLFLQDPIRI